QSPYPPSQCTDGETGSNCLTDSQLRQEVAKEMSLQGWTGGPTHMFFVYTGRGEGSKVDDIPGFTDEAYTNYCGYHYWFHNTKLNQAVIYANMPYPDYGSFFYGDCNQVPTSPNNNVDADTAISVTSHELYEAITDWDGSTGWGNNTGGEIGD